MPSSVAINLGAEQKMKSTDTQNALEKLKSEGWLDIDDKGFVSFSVRSCFELKPLLEEYEYDTGFEF